jgi:hypothetical protein
VRPMSPAYTLLCTMIDGVVIERRAWPDQYRAPSTVKAKNATFYAKRTSRGRFKEMDEKGRSLKSDRRTKAKRTVKSGHGDQGDRKKRRAA